MLQRLSIRGKLLAVVAVPILVLIVAAGVITLGSVQDLNAARNAEELIDTLDRARDVQADLQDERAIAANYVHTVQNGETNLRNAYNATASAVTDIENRLAEPDVENPEEIQDAVDAALSRSGDDMLASERALRLGSATEETDGWPVFPAEDEIAAMEAAYAAVVADINAVIDSVPEDLNIGVPLSALAFRVNAESETATGLFTEPLQYQQELIATAGRVDSGVQRLLGSAESLGQTEENARAVEALLSGQEAIANLEQIRADTRAVNTGPATVTTYYTGIIRTVVSAADAVAVAMADREMVSAIQAYGDLDALVENMKYEEVVIERLIRAGSFLPGEAAAARSFTTQTDLSLVDAQNSATAIAGIEEVPPFGASVSESLADSNSYESVRTLVLTGLDSSLFSARTGDWNQQVSEELAVYEPLREQVWDAVEARAGVNAQNALVQTILTAVAVATVVIVSIVVALIIARTIIGPLRRLTTTATAVRQDLPRLVERVAIPGETVDVSEVQIPVESRDEVGRLAEAFNGVNAATLDIAGEQAALRGSISEMFVNVARRDQVLLNRQLSSIDEMERSEDNPETLTKLFALDHLATRMRRNSESLLVLAGIDTGRRLRRPMPLSDVVRTASSEIELYERVQLELDVDPHMLGHSALTTAHLIAELLENATVFSDPGTSVVVRTGQRDDDFVVEVVDSGIGMTPKELDDANGRVNSTSASEILGAQRLGLFVVGRIARRVGATVTIDSQESKGTVATVSLPKTMFAQGEAPAPARSQAGTVDAATHAPIALTQHNLADEVADSPARAPLGADAYTPTAIGGGTSLSGRGGSNEPAGTDASIEDLIASDAANAPVAEPADPAALTDGSSAAGLPSRRRRESPQSAQEGGEQIVGLPARATDAQLSALAAEQAGGFTPAVSAAEVAPQTAEERASMFRGFRARRGNEAQAQAEQAPQSSTPGIDDDQGIPVDNAGASALPVRTPAAPTPPAPTQPSQPTSTRDAGMAAAGAAGAAAFFARRARDEAAGVGITPAGQAPAFADAPDSDAQELHGFEQANAPELSPSAPSAATSSAQEPADEHSRAEEPSAPAVPVFHMPKFEDDSVDSAQPVDRGQGIGTSQALPKLEPEVPDLAPADSDYIGAPGFEASPYVVPSLEEDEPAAAEPEQPTGYPADADAAATPYGGVEQVSLEADAPSADHAIPEEYESAPQYDQQPYGQQSYEQQQYEQPAAPAQPQNAAPWLAGSTEPVATPAPASETTAEFASAASAPTPAPDTARAPVSAHSERANAHLDALLQSAADNDTEERPGFFSRLFGRGKNNDPDVAGAAATQWADVGSDSPSPANAAPAAMAFSPVADPVPTATPRESMFAPQPAPEVVQPPVNASAPAAPASAAPWETAPQGFSPAPTSQASAPAVSTTPAWQAEPMTPEPMATSLHEPAPWEQRQPASEPSVPAPEQAPQATFTPDQLADATGWEAAGASALQAAQPDVAKSYQPVIQPDESGVGVEADLTSAVFSEFSSLASERPKVEKTRAGLERRRPSDAKPVEVKPIDENVEMTPAKRDANEIRSRFSSFYSGTQRARDDVATHDRGSHTTEVSDT